jgi:hypothetical protein
MNSVLDIFTFFFDDCNCKIDDSALEQITLLIALFAALLLGESSLPAIVTDLRTLMAFEPHFFCSAPALSLRYRSSYCTIIIVALLLCSACIFSREQI